MIFSGVGPSGSPKIIGKLGRNRPILGVARVGGLLFFNFCGRCRWRACTSSAHPPTFQQLHGPEDVLLQTIRLYGAGDESLLSGCPLRQKGSNQLFRSAASDSSMSYSDTARSRRTQERTRNNESIVQQVFRLCACCPFHFLSSSICMQDLVNVLQHLDRDADGRLSFDEFAQGISRLGINLHEGELQVRLSSWAAQHTCDNHPCSDYMATSGKWQRIHPAAGAVDTGTNQPESSTFTALSLLFRCTFTTLSLHFYCTSNIDFHCFRSRF